LRVFLSKAFSRFQRKQAIPDTSLVEAVNRAARGLIDADLGGGLIKPRVARPGRGRAGGYRVLIVYRRAHRAVFLMGLPRANGQTSEAMSCLEAREARLEALLAEGRLMELDHDDEA
jgi:hypothetical protein